MPVRMSRASSVVVHRVPPAAADRFLAAQDGFTAAAEGFAGYQGTDLYPPAEPGSVEWVVVIHFADAAALQRWLDSPVRAEVADRVRKEIGDFELTTLPGGFGAWFASHRPDAPAPPAWKIVLTVVLGLFPTVLLIDLAVGAQLQRLGFVPAMLVGNFLSVSILQWAVMPVLTRLFAPWLNAGPGRPGHAAAGAGLIAALLAGLVFVFQAVR